MRNSMIAALLLGVAACDAEAPQTGMPGEELYDPAWLDQPVRVTRVEVTEEGVGRVEVVEATRRQQLREAQAEADMGLPLPLEGNGLGQTRQAVTARTPPQLCATTDFRMWEEPWYTGDSLCLYGTDAVVRLDDYTFLNGSFVSGWGGNVESYKSGSYTGSFKEGSGWACGSLDYDDVAADEDFAEYYAAPNQWEYLAFGDFCTR